jgi:hypothetical protein
LLPHLLLSYVEQVPTFLLFHRLSVLSMANFCNYNVNKSLNAPFTLK